MLYCYNETEGTEKKKKKIIFKRFLTTVFVKLKFFRGIDIHFGVKKLLY